MPAEAKRQALLEATDVGAPWGDRAPAYRPAQRPGHMECMGTLADDRRGRAPAADRRRARIAAELRGISCLAIEDVIPPRQNIISSRSFGRAIEVLADMREAVAYHASRAAEKMRRDGTVTDHLRVFLETNPFRGQDAQYHGSAAATLTTPTNYTPALIEAAMRALERCWRDGYRYKKAGVMAFDLHAETAVQSAFDTPTPAAVEQRRRAPNRLAARQTTYQQRLGWLVYWKVP